MVDSRESQDPMATRYPFIQVYRRNVAQTSYEQYEMSIIRSKSSAGVQKLEILPKAQNGWTFILVIFERSLCLVRFKEKKFQIVGRNEKLALNSRLVYGVNARGDIIATDERNRLFYLPCRS